ncbi:NADP-dependent 3-hydroxy acid dehydrogenase YdfG [Pseudoduganella lurida]|uniref:NADP-dependent 3-hydroxy acid dehydrogenase YdfG n=1 Tax=Pseudoduganella lurida TaxID=1036180 RepID=A0A562RL18_9BURK|nr:SDR family oxidoreductase [Pseudoduganella lurida]TWI69583.1 NADP-dependent 3-hydroxy acid dehydrogenase YdfG [Pseudoduganella lurida]
MAEQKIILITGASSGIGAATAHQLASDGHHVVLGARRTDRLETLVADIRAAGGSAEFHALDVTDADGMQTFALDAHRKHGRVDVIVNNAGVMPLSRMDALKLKEWDRMIDVNVRGVLYGIAAVLPLMQRAGGGHVINVASIGAHAVSPTAAVYCATKYAVWAISEGLRQEEKAIRVTVISPGVTTSELADSISDEGGRAEMREFRKVAIGADAIGRAISYAIAQPADVDVSEIVVRPTASPY